MLKTALILFMLFSTASCNPVTQVKKWIFGEKKEETVQKEVETKKKPISPRKETDEKTVIPPKPEEPPAPVEPSAAGAEGSETQAPLPLAQLPTLETAKTAEVQSLVESIDHFGGIPSVLMVDSGLTAAAFGRRLILYNQELVPQGSILLEAAMEQGVTQKRGEELFLFAKEEGDILEILRLPAGNKPELVKSFKADGPLTISPNGEFFVFLPDKIQVLGLAQPTDVSVLFELPFASAKQVYSREMALYVIQAGHLNVVAREGLSVFSSLPLGEAFHIVGHRTRKDGKEELILAEQSTASTKWKGLVSYTLAPGGGIAEIGRLIPFSREADQVVIDRNGLYAYLVGGGEVSLFDLEEKTELKGAPFPVADVRTADGAEGLVVFASATRIGRSEMERVEAPPPANEAQKSLPPLAKGTPIHYRWKGEITMPLAGLVRSLFLSGNGALVVDESGLFYFPSFLEDPARSSPVSFPANGGPDIELMEPLEEGALVYEKGGGKIYRLKSDFSSAAPVALPPLSMAGMESVATQEGIRLYVTSTVRDGKGENALMAFLLNEAGAAKKLSALPLKQPGGLKVFENGKKALVACGPEGTCLVDLSGEKNKMSILSRLIVAEPGQNVTEVALSPSEKIGYFFMESSSGNSIALFDLSANPPQQLSIIRGVPMTREQFRGLTFSAGGQKLILPQMEGVTLFNLSAPTKPSLIYHWPVGKTLSVDVTQRGTLLCAALGEKGVECGRLQ